MAAAMQPFLLEDYIFNLDSHYFLIPVLKESCSPFFAKKISTPKGTGLVKKSRRLPNRLRKLRLCIPRYISINPRKLIEKITTEYMRTQSLSIQD